MGDFKVEWSKGEEKVVDEQSFDTREEATTFGNIESTQMEKEGWEFRVMEQQGKKYKVSFITNNDMEQEAAELKEFLTLQQAEGNISDLVFEEFVDDVLMGA